MGMATILVVEDEAIVAKDIQQTLSLLGYSVPMVAYSGEDAIVKAGEIRPDLVLMDIVLRGAMDGIQAAEHIHEKFDIPIVYLTAYTDSDTFQRAKITEPFGYIIKPLEHRELFTAIEIALYKHKTERRIRESKEWLETTLKSIGDAVIATDQSGVITFMNAGAEELTAWEGEQGRGVSLSHVLNVLEPSTRSRIENPVLRALTEPDQGGENAGQVLLINKSGKEIPIEYMVTPIRDPKGKVLGEVLVFRDITVRLRAREERERLLAAEQKALDEAKRSNRAKDLFLAMVSHELRTPLTSMLTWVQLIRSGRLQPESVARGLEIIEKNVRSQEQLINDLLDVSRIMTGKLSLSLREVPLIDVVNSVIESGRPIAEAKSIKFEAELLAPEGVFAHVDPARLEQVLWNLLTNSIKFTPSGGRVKIRFDVEPGGAPGLPSRARIQVSDTGRGIRPDFLPQIFEQFTQGDHSTTREYGGLGLGLAIVRSLVEMQGGTVTAESQGEGKGATFTVLLPISELSSQREKNHVISVAQARGGGFGLSVVAGGAESRLNGMRVLLVDDEATAREAFSAMLSSEGADVALAGSVSEAMALLPRFHPHILISDIAMPGEDGYSLIRKIRKLSPELGGSVPSIAVTAFADEESRNLALGAGFESYISKPVDAAHLMKTITDVAKWKVAES